MKISKISTRGQLLSGAAALVIVSASASAQTVASVVTADPALSSTVVGSIVSGDGAAQVNSAAVGANVTGSTITTTVSGAATGSFVNSDNTADALAQANINGVTVSLATTSSSATADGIAVATVSDNSGAISSSAVNQDAGAVLTGFTSGSVEVASNSIDATTTINDGSGTAAVTLNNSLPVGYTTGATEPATAIIGSTNDAVNADGTLVVGNTQVTLGLDSSAVAGSAAETAGDENTVILTLGSLEDNTVTGSAVLDSNNVGAEFTGNTRTASIGIAADDASFAGTAVIANSQSFDGNTTDVNALNQDSRIAATVASDDLSTAGEANVFSNSSLSVDSNQITSAASGNVQAGTISLADGLSYDAAGAGPNSSSALVNNVAATGAEDINATGSLAIASTQTNDDGTLGAILTATTDDATITASVQESIGSATTVSGNRVTAAVTGNDLTSTIASGEGSALFDGSATLANLQTNATDTREFAITANATDTVLSLTLGDTDNGTVSGSSGTIDGNVIASSAFGSEADQTIDLEAASLVTSDGYSVLTGDSSPSELGDAGLSATGAVSIASRQSNEDAPITANTTGTTITLASNDDDADTAGTDLAVTNNIQQAFAVGADAGNTLGLTGVSVGSGAGILNLQQNEAGAEVAANLTGSAQLIVTGDAGDDAGVLAPPSLTLSGNRSEALGTGVTSANALSVDATTVELEGAVVAGGAQQFDPASATGTTSSASYAMANVQTVNADVSATAEPLASENAFDVQVTADTRGATVANTDNRLTAQARAAVADNSIDLDIGTILFTNGSTTDSNNVAAILNVQEVARTAASVVATAAPDGAAVVLTDLDGEVENASVATSANRVTAIADGAVASNTLSAEGTSLQVFDGAAEGDAGLASASTTGVLTANAAFSMINRQEFNFTGPVTATLQGTDTGTITDSALVLTDVDGAVSSSGIASNGNQLTALASSLEAANTLSLDGTSLRTTGALVNSQDSSAEVNALIGFDGGAGTPGSEAVTVALSGSGTVPNANFTLGSGNIEATGGDLEFTVSALSADDATALVNLGFSATAGATTVTLLAGNLVSTAVFDDFTTSASGATETTISFDGFVTTPATPPTLGTPNAGGVQIALDGNVTGSDLAVSGNTATGQALGNMASNSLNVSATSLDADGANAAGPATAGLLADGSYGADDDFVLFSDQSVQGDGEGGPASASNAEVFATFAIDQAADQSISNSTLAVDDNAQVAEAMANTVTNTLSVSATDMDVTEATSASLANRQGGTANVDASSDMEVFANVQASGSTITLDGNSNRALGVVNNAANTLTVEGTNIAGTGSNASATLSANDTIASGSFALNNSQTTALGSDLDTTATTNIYNNDLVDEASTGIVNSSVSMANNLTFAESGANRASNMVMVDGGAGNAAPAALANDQSSAATVNATATSTIQTSLFGTDGEPDLEAADGSSASIAGNSTQALARGNMTTNTMVFNAGSNFGTATTGANVNSTPGASAGAAVVLNSQINTGAVGAQATATYRVVLNGETGASDAGALNSRVAVSGNTVAATAFGNQATNRIELSSLPSGNATAAFHNVQSNSGAITASATSVNYTVGFTGTVTNGAVSNAGNASSATAVGNSSVTSIVGR